jgi:hypothetical protein
MTAVLVFLVSATGAHSVGVTIGGFGGMNIPIVQDDAGSGPLYGIRVKIAANLPFVVEPYFVSISEGDVDHSDEGIEFTQKGGSIQSFGVDLAFGGYRARPGANLYFVAGLGAHSRDPGQDYRDKETRFGFDIGLGLVAKVAPMLDLDVGGRLHAFTLEEGGSRKSVGITAGLNYYFMP